MGWYKSYLAAMAEAGGRHDEAGGRFSSHANVSASSSCLIDSARHWLADAADAFVALGEEVRTSSAFISLHQP